MATKLSDVAYNAIEQLKLSLSANNISIPEEIHNFAVNQTIFQHGKHIKVHRVKQTSVDPYKIVCWYGFSLIKIIELNLEDSADCTKLRLIAQSMISTLEGFLNIESHGTIILPSKTRLFLLQLIEEEQKGNIDHGIGKNGLYAAFHCAVESLRCINNPKETLNNL